MHERGWLDTKISPNNRRQHITVITSKGERLASEALRILNEFHGPMFESIGEKGQQQLLDMLLLMHQNTCQSGKTGACDHPYSVDLK